MYMYGYMLCSVHMCYDSMRYTFILGLSCGRVYKFKLLKRQLFLEIKFKEYVYLTFLKRGQVKTSTSFRCRKYESF